MNLQKKRRTFSTRRKHSISAATTAERGLMRESLETAVIKEEEELGEGEERGGGREGERVRRRGWEGGGGRGWVGGREG